MRHRWPSQASDIDQLELEKSEDTIILAMMVVVVAVVWLVPVTASMPARNHSSAIWFSETMLKRAVLTSCGGSTCAREFAVVV